MTHRTIQIPAEGVTLPGELTIPLGAPGVVVFAHGSGSSRHSPRNQAVAAVIRERGLGTLLFDLLTEAEDVDREARFDIDRLADRLGAAVDWLRRQPEVSGGSIGLFGSSTGAAAAVDVAATERADIAAVVSRGGRVDLAAARLPDVTAATLFIVGGADESVLELNREAFTALRGVKSLHVIAGAGHLLEGPGELDEVADVAADWFARHLGSAP